MLNQHLKTNWLLSPKSIMELQTVRLSIRVVSTQINLSTPKSHLGNVARRFPNAMLVEVNIAIQRGATPRSRIIFLKTVILICTRVIQDLKILWVLLKGNILPLSAHFPKSELSDRKKSKDTEIILHLLISVKTIRPTLID